MMHKSRMALPPRLLACGSLFAVSLLGGCGSDTMGVDDLGQDLAMESSVDLAMPDLVPPTPQIKHVVLIVQENHSFDTYFGRYCTASAGSSPTCTSGPTCCEAAPVMEASGSPPVVLDDALNAGRDPDHSKACMVAGINGGKMDRYVTGAFCSDARNFAIAPSSLVKPYHDFAKQYALGDRYFHPVAGASSMNDMYFAVAKYEFTDNDQVPDANGRGCWYPIKTPVSYTGKKTIADVLASGGHTFSVYAEGYQAMKDAVLCPFSRPADCTFTTPLVTPNTCVYDPSDYPFQYYAQLADKPQYIRDLSSFSKDIAAGTLPTFSFVKGTSYHTEHPNFGNKISMGAAFVQGLVGQVLSSQYANDTLILVTWDESGGFYDHVPPPPTNPIDGQASGLRVPFLAIGRFARKNHVSHVVMEHSSILKFLEYNFLDGKTGQLGNRDTNVNNIGSLLDPNQTGIVIPEN